MKKKTLKEQINDAVFWLIIFFIVYLVMGYLIQSSWLSNVPEVQEIYDIAKDGLSIAAAFFAPVAAFILFSDWRAQHEDLATETESTKIFNILCELKDKLFEAHFAIDDDEFKQEATDKIFNEIANKIKEVRLLNDQLKGRTNGNKFTECADKLIEEIVQVSLELSQLFSYRVKILNPEEYNEYVDTSPEEYADHIQVTYYDPLLNQISRSYPTLNILKIELSSLCNQLKIKA